MNGASSALKKKKKRRKRIRAIRRAICMAGLMVAIVAALRSASAYLLVEDTMEHKEDEHVKAVSATAAPAATPMTVSEPTKRASSQIYEDLKAYAKKNKSALQIYKNRNEYPEMLLAAYLNNPEMEQFVQGYLTQDTLSQDRQLNEEERQTQFPLLLQWDQRWGYVSYGGSIIGLSGCGPTCLSMILISLTGDPTQTPDIIAAFSETNGYYVEGSGTAWSLMTEGASRLGLYAQELSLDESVMKSQLDAGHPIICSMGAGDFTTEGHFILIYGYNENGFLVNDPNCIGRSGQAWTFDRLCGQIKDLWAYARG